MMSWCFPETQHPMAVAWDKHRQTPVFCSPKRHVPHLRGGAACGPTLSVLLSIFSTSEHEQQQGLCVLFSPFEVTSEVSNQDAATTHLDQMKHIRAFLMVHSTSSSSDGGIILLCQSGAEFKNRSQTEVTGKHWSGLRFKSRAYPKGS